VDALLGAEQIQGAETADATDNRAAPASLGGESDQTEGCLHGDE